MSQANLIHITATISVTPTTDWISREFCSYRKENSKYENFGESLKSLVRTVLGTNIYKTFILWFCPHIVNKMNTV